MNVTAAPPDVNDNLNSSSVTLIAYTVDGNTLPFDITIAVAVTPSKVETGVYCNSSPDWKKWSLSVNVPELNVTRLVSEGLNVFVKIGVPL